MHAYIHTISLHVKEGFQFMEPVNVDKRGACLCLILLSQSHSPRDLAWAVQVTNRVAFYDDGDDLRLEKFISIANRCVKGVIGVDAGDADMCTDVRG